ncbi:MAG: hypothetical protein HPY61_13695 [Methanotrichaceae archaeon]|nr:hypothetical protein [Methanotrichaceae archaeon]
MTEETQAQNQDRKDAVRKLLVEYGRALAPSLNVYQWPVETARWHELVFCLLFRIGQPQIQADRARGMTQMLADLNLLEVSSLAGAMAEKGKAQQHPDIILMHTLLERMGMTPDQSREAALTIAQAAQVLAEKHNGKVQHCLRQYGQQMLNHLIEQFSFDQIPSDQAKLALAHWLQNTTNMPIELAEPEVIRFCQEAGITLQELTEIADEIDLNLALLDDIIVNSQLSFASEESKDESRRAGV